MTETDRHPSPTPDEICAARKAAGLTQREAANLIHATERAWRYWEAGERGMSPDRWELFTIKANQPRQ